MADNLIFSHDPDDLGGFSVDLYSFCLDIFAWTANEKWQT